MKFSKRTLAILVVTLLGIEMGVAVAYKRWKHQSEVNALLTDIPVGIAWGAGRVTRGNSQAKYHLVEFGDFQCVPCRIASDEVTAWLQSTPDEIIFQFRHFPISAIHPKAREYALQVESQSTSTYWQTYDALFKLQDQVIEKQDAPAKTKLANVNETAILHVDQDCALAQKYHLPGTPTLLLITPSGKIYRSASVAYMRSLVNEKW